MKISTYLLQLALLMITIFGGTFMIHYLKTGEMLIDQIIGCSFGMLVLFSAVIFRRKQYTIQNK